MPPNTPAPAPEAAPASEPITADQIAAMISAALARAMAAPPVPWWVPPWPVMLACGLYIMSFWVLYILAPARGEDASELFKTLATAVVLTAFVNGVVAAVFTAGRDSQKKNDTIAAQARVIAGHAPPTA